MTTIVGRNCKIEVALTFDAASAATAVTAANPAVATLTSHSVDTGDVGYWVVTAGMVEAGFLGIAVRMEATACTVTGLSARYSPQRSAHFIGRRHPQNGKTRGEDRHHGVNQRQPRFRRLSISFDNKT